MMLALVVGSSMLTTGYGHGLGQIKSLPRGTRVTLDYDATVLYSDYFALFLKDATGYATITGDRSTSAYTDGDVIKAGYSATVGGNFGFAMGEMHDASGMQLADTVIQPPVREVTVNGLRTARQGELVVLRDMVLNPYTKTLTDANGNSCMVYQDFYFPAVEGNIAQQDDAEDYYVIVLGSNLVYLTHDILYYGLGYDYSLVPAGTEVRLRFDLTVLYQHGDYTYVKDRTGYGLLYGPMERSYAPGDIISHEVYVDRNMADGEVRLDNPRNIRKLVDRHDSIVPEEIHVTDVNHGHWAHYVKLSGVTVSDIDGDDFVITDEDGNTCLGHNTFGQALAEGRYNELEGIVGSYQPTCSPAKYRLMPILPPDTVSVGTIAEMLALPRGTLGRFDKPLTAIYQNGLHLYVQDSAGDQALIYGDVDYGFSNGDIIEGAVARWTSENLCPAHTYYTHYAPLILPVSGWTKTGQGEAVKPTKADIADVNTSLLYHYIEVPNVYRYVSTLVCDSTRRRMLDIDNEFGVALPELERDKAYDMVCFVAYLYNGTWNVYPLEIWEHVDVTYPRGDVNEDNEVNLGDVNTVLDCILGQKGYYARRSDMDNDGEVTISDLNCVMDILLAQ